MKIMHVIDSGGLYGAEIMLLNLMQEQSRMGLEPLLASIGDPCVAEKQIEQEASRLGLRCVAFRFRPGPNLAGALEILACARREQVSLIHSHGYKGNILFGFIPKVLRRIPVVSTVHGWTWSGGFSRMLLYEWLDVLALRCMDRVVLVNGAVRSHPRLRGDIQQKITVIENGINCNETPIPDAAGVDPQIVSFCKGRKIIGAIGRLSREKNFSLLIDAFAELAAQADDLRLLILGEGTLRAELEQQVSRLGLQDCVFMPGYRPQAHIYLPLFNIFAMPSLTEGLPMTLLEAMRTRTPIIASTVGGIPQLLDQGSAGMLIPPGRLEPLVSGIAEMLENADATALKTEAAYRRLRENYSSSVMSEKYLAIYKEVVCRHAD